MNMMIKSATYLIALLMPVVVFSADQKKAEFSLTIQATPDTIKPGSPVKIQVVRKNETDHVISNGRASAFLEYNEVDVRDERGQAVPENAIKREIEDRKKRSNGHISSYVFGSLKPGESFQETVDLSIYFDLNQLGKYTIQIQQYGVKSNTIVVTVTP